MKKSWVYILILTLAFTMMGVVTSTPAEAASCRVVATKTGNIIRVRGFGACRGLRFAFKVNDAAASGGQGSVGIKVPTKYRTRIKHKVRTVYKDRPVYITKIKYKTKIRTRIVRIPGPPAPPLPRQTGHNRDTLIPQPADRPLIDLWGGTTVERVGLGLATLFLLMLLLLAGMHAGYYMGYKDSEQADSRFMRALRDKILTRAD